MYLHYKHIYIKYDMHYTLLIIKKEISRKKIKPAVYDLYWLVDTQHIHSLVKLQFKLVHE